MILYGIIVVLSSTFIGILALWYYQYFRLNRYYSKYKGPPPIPIFGNVLGIKSNADIIPVFLSSIKKYGPDIKVWFGFSPRLLIGDYRTAELLLTSNTIIDKSNDYNYLHPWLGTGLLTSSGDKWRRQRKLITPAFHFQILEQYIAVFNNQSDILIKILSKIVHNQPVDIYPYINLCALDIICETAMGIKIYAQEGHASEYVRAVTDVTEIFLRRAVSVFKRFEVLHGQTYRVIKDRQNELAAQTNCTDNSEQELGIKKRIAFLDLLLNCRVDGAPLPLENIREEVDTFMFEGHDTTASAISFIIYCLSQNLHVQQKVVEELYEIFENSDIGDPTYKQLLDMKYLEMVIKESMRLYPPVPHIARTIVKDTEFDGSTYCKGGQLTIFMYGLHRQEEMFPNAERFYPERFSTENVQNRNPFAYVPFSAGPRNCIGQRFAMLEMKSIVSKILRNFIILPAPGFEPILSPAAVLRSTNGILVILKERKL